jgi:hypothetical protein
MEWEELLSATGGLNLSAAITIIIIIIIIVPVELRSEVI